MKEPIEYLGNVNAFTTREELYNIGKQMQIDAYNEAINDTVNNVKTKWLYFRKDDNPEEFDDYEGVGFHREDSYGETYAVDVVEIDKDSILKLLKS